jgi:hypothetical protein
MSRTYIRLLATAALLTAATGASFSIFGLAQLFAGAPWSVGFMAGVLEFSKLVSTGFLFRYWGHIPSVIKSYLTAAVVVLMCITSMGIYGYLSAAYQKSALSLGEQKLRIAALEGERADLLAQVAETRRFIDEIPRSRITRKLQLYEEAAPKLSRVHQRAAEIQAQVQSLRLEQVSIQSKLGPIVYLAESVGASVDSCVRVLITLFVLVFDPLAICLVFALNLAIRVREKYRGDDVRIAARSLTKPVDHRFKKAG